MSRLPARTRDQTEGGDRLALEGGTSLRSSGLAGASWTSWQDGCLWFSVGKAISGRSFRTKLGVAHGQSLGLAQKLSQLSVVAFCLSSLTL